MEHSHTQDCNHQDSCGCGCGCAHEYEPEPNQAEIQILRDLAKLPCVPVVRFMLSSTKSAHLLSQALAPVYLTQEDATMEQVKAVGSCLLGLVDKGLLAIDYDAKLADTAYTLYQKSAVYCLFCETVAQAKQQSNFLHDTGLIEEGAMVVTPMGHAWLAKN